jgi:hypothetical protein
MTLNVSPEAIARMRAVAKQNIAAGGWVADLSEAFDPAEQRGPGGRWQGDHGLARISSLGIHVHPPGEDSKLEAGDTDHIASALEGAFQKYPELKTGNGMHLDEIAFKSSPLHMEPIHLDRPQRLRQHMLGMHYPDDWKEVVADDDTVAATYNPPGWDHQALVINDSKTIGEHTGNGIKQGYIAPAHKTFEGVAWHEMGHAVINQHRQGKGGSGDELYAVDQMTKQNLGPRELNRISSYAAASPSEALAELFTMWNTPGMRQKIPADIRAQVGRVVESL